MPKRIKVESNIDLWNRLQFTKNKIDVLGHIIQNDMYVEVRDIINWGDMAGRIIADLEDICNDIADHLGKHA